jgi:hypothetical protein
LPGIPSSAYGTVEGILALTRSIINDARIPGGDVLTDNALFTFPFVNAAYGDVQFELENAGAEGFNQEAWLLGVPPVPTSDPGARVSISDSGTEILYPDGSGSVVATPKLPDDLIEPIKLKERASGSTNEPTQMGQPKDGLPFRSQGSNLGVWEWRTDEIVLVGATTSIDLWLRYHRRLAPLVATTDPVPIRSVDTIVAFYIAAYYAGARGSPMAAQLEQQGDHNLDLYVRRITHRKQHTSHRRRPFSMRSRRPRSF